MSPQDEAFPSAPQALLLLVALFLLEILVGLLLHGLRHSLPLTPNERDALVSLLANGIFFSVLMHVKAMSYRALFHPSAASVKATLGMLLPAIVLIVPGLVVVASAVTDLLVSLLPLSPWEQDAFDRMGAHNVAAVVTACVLAPVLEEMLFRGLILRSFLRQYPRGLAIFASAMLFGLAHLNVYQFVVAFMLGTVSGWLYERTRSLAPSIALHGLYNSSLTVLEMALSDEALDTSTSIPWPIWVAAALAAAIGIMMLRRLLQDRQRKPAG